MAFTSEFNTILVVEKKTRDFEQLKVGGTYTFRKKEAHIYPIGIPILLVDAEFSVFGYCVVLRTTSSPEGINIRFRVISKFTRPERRSYTSHLLVALKETGIL